MLFTTITRAQKGCENQSNAATAWMQAKENQFFA